ncbi:MAG: hypothetical protein K2J36_06980 [Ruminococcus sp.]|nr:hypothetical protein [Ruminococcus sp.]
MFDKKVKCIYCDKKINKYINICNKCGRDISSMWAENTPAPENPETPKTPDIPLFCPNKKCRFPYAEGSLFCPQCRNDYAKNPPVPDDSPDISGDNGIFCPVCGLQSNPDDIFCDCGCDFRANPRISKPLPISHIFYCSVCNLRKVSGPDEMCDSCRNKASQKKCLCPECKVRTVSRFGEVCPDCISKKQLRGMGEGFMIPR